MARARDGRLARLAAESTRRDSALEVDEPTLSAWHRVRAFVRDGLLQAGIDSECATALRQGPAAGEMAELHTKTGDYTKLAGEAAAEHDGLAGECRARIAGIARRFADGHQPDFASASLAELLAWCFYRRGSCDR